MSFCPRTLLGVPPPSPIVQFARAPLAESLDLPLIDANILARYYFEIREKPRWTYTIYM